MGRSRFFYAGNLSQRLATVDAMQSSIRHARPGVIDDITREIALASPSEVRAYLAGSSRDATWNKKHRTTRWAQSDRRWLEIIQQLLSRLGSKAWIYREGTRQVWVAETTYRVMPNPLSSKLTDLAAWARGYFDAEGGVARDRSARFYVQFVQKNKIDLECLKGVLENLGIRCGAVHTPSVRVDPDYCRVYVAAHSQMAFIRTVGSWHPRKRSLLLRKSRVDP